MRRYGRVFLVTILIMMAVHEELEETVHAATSTLTTKKIKDVGLGEVIQIGDSKFAKIGANSLMMVERFNGTCTDPTLTTTGAIKNFAYTGNYQTFTAYAGCLYKFEMWGAQAGAWGSSVNAKYGAYVSGNITFTANTSLYVYVGQGWAAKNTKSFNGTTASNGDGDPGGGATDVRTVGGTWTDINSLRSRIIVAGGGGSACYRSDGCGATSGGSAGGLIGYSSSCNGQTNTGGTQVSGGWTAPNGDYSATFGIGSAWGATGGGGWYGGGGAAHAYGSGAGGSSYISGHTGCVAVTSLSDTTPKTGCATGTSDNACSLSPTGLSFTDTVMIDGNGYAWTNVKGALQQMPNPDGGYYGAGLGRTGHGYARITRLN